MDGEMLKSEERAGEKANANLARSIFGGTADTLDRMLKGLQSWVSGASLEDTDELMAAMNHITEASVRLHKLGMKAEK